jgi:hypothetical protein
MRLTQVPLTAALAADPSRLFIVPASATVNFEDGAEAVAGSYLIETLSGRPFRAWRLTAPEEE